MQPHPMSKAFLAAHSRDKDGLDRSMMAVYKELGDAASYQYAEIYAEFGDKERALAALEQGLEIRDSGLAWIRVDPYLDPLRGERRFQTLIGRLDFPT